jgi:hypothetical protein
MAIAKKKDGLKKTAPQTKKLHSTKQPFVFHRIIIISACVVVVLGGLFAINRRHAMQAVAGASIARGLFVQVTVQIPFIPEAASYNIYYKQDNAKEFTNAVRNITPNITQYTISYLKKGINYQYRVAAVDSTGREFMFTQAEPLTNLQPME